LDQQPTCPDCGSSRQALIVYGLPEFTSQLLARLEAGSVVLGGCCIHGDDAEWRCLDCRREWGISRQSRSLYELAGSERSSPPASLWVRLLSWIFFLLLLPLFVLAKAFGIICFRAIPAMQRAKVRCLRFLRRGSA
jgi:hypothetical protein